MIQLSTGLSGTIKGCLPQILLGQFLNTLSRLYFIRIGSLIHNFKILASLDFIKRMF